MKLYVGTKLIRAIPMNRLAYNVFRGWELPEDEDGTDEGYLVEYLDGGKPNTDTYEGYISWSPTEVFENAYKASGELTFGQATELARKGYRIARSGWNGAGMFAYIVSADEYPAKMSQIQGYFPKDMVPYREYWALKTAQEDVAAWTPSGTDTLASDWGVV